MKATADEQQLHSRLVAGSDPTALPELADWLYEDLVRETARRAGPQADAVLVEEAVGQALLDYGDRPQAYDPERSALRDYLAWAAYRDYQNARNKEARWQKPLVSLITQAGTPRELADPQQDLERLHTRLSVQAVWTRIRAAFPDPTELGIIRLLAAGIRSPEPYCQVLGMMNLPEPERNRQVKRAKDRIAKRLRRLGEQLDEHR